MRTLVKEKAGAISLDQMITSYESRDERFGPFIKKLRREMDVDACPSKKIRSVEDLIMAGK